MTTRTPNPIAKKNRRGHKLCPVPTATTAQIIVGMNNNWTTTVLLRIQLHSPMPKTKRAASATLPPAKPMRVARTISMIVQRGFCQVEKAAPGVG